jgi:hypothetical protein
MDHYINGRALSESIQRFPGMMERTFQRRSSLAIPLLSRAYELTASYLADGLYPAGAIESVLKEAFGADKNILDCSYATATGTKVGLPVATVSRYPSYRVFTNYNGVGKRDEDMGGHLLGGQVETQLTGAKTEASSSRRTELGECRCGKCKSPPPSALHNLTTAPAPVL